MTHNLDLGQEKQEEELQPRASKVEEESRITNHQSKANVHDDH